FRRIRVANEREAWRLPTAASLWQPVRPRQADLGDGTAAGASRSPPMWSPSRSGLPHTPPGQGIGDVPSGERIDAMKSREQVEQMVRYVRSIIECGRHLGRPTEAIERDEQLLLWVLGEKPDPPGLANVDRIEEVVAAAKGGAW